MGLKDIDRQTYRALETWFAGHPYPPTIKELTDTMHLSSTSIAVYRLTSLEDAGLLSWPQSSLGRRMARTMKLLPMKESA